MKAKTILTWCSMILLLHSGVTPAQAQEITLEARTALQYFIDLDCEVGNDGAALNNLLKYKTAVQSTLVTYLRNGPDMSSLNTFQNNLAQEWIQLERSMGYEKKALFLDLNRIAFVQKYREKSAIALAAIGTPEAVRALQDMRTTENEGLRTVINAAMRQFNR